MAIVQLPLAHPLRIAEEIATLDVLSGGRVELGVGRGASPKHYENFNIPLNEGRERMVAALDYIKLAFTQDSFSYQGRFFQAHDVCLVPRPIQRPYPPIRIAANGVETLEFAGQQGYPILLAAHLNPLPRLSKLLPMYHAARSSRGHADATDDDISILLPMYLDDSQTEVKKWAEPAVNTYSELLAWNLSKVAEKLESESERKRMELGIQKVRATTLEEMNGAMAIFDTPEACVTRLTCIRQELNAGRVICWFDFTGVIPHERVMRSMELFAVKVLPYL